MNTGAKQARLSRACPKDIKEGKKEGPLLSDINGVKTAKKARRRISVVGGKREKRVLRRLHDL